MFGVLSGGWGAPPTQPVERSVLTQGRVSNLLLGGELLISRTREGKTDLTLSICNLSSKEYYLPGIFHLHNHTIIDIQMFCLNCFFVGKLNGFGIADLPPAPILVPLLNIRAGGEHS